MGQGAIQRKSVGHKNERGRQPGVGLENKEMRMTDKQPVQPVNDEADSSDGVNAVKKGSGGESAGGAYRNPNGPDTPAQSGPMGHGGQTHIDYSGPDENDVNAPTRDE